MKFSLGKLVITRRCKAHMDAQYANPMRYVLRHVAGDWGDLGAEDKAANEFALNKKLRILSAYNLPDGERIYVITEADRSYTTIILYMEY
jgi:hypothetical protein